MKQLIQRAYRVFRNEGAIETINQSVRFLTGKLHYTFGINGLFHSERYRSFIFWWNSGRGKYSAPADPFKICWVDPHEISYITNRDPFPGDFKWQHIGKVQGGDWDQSTDRVADLLVYLGIKERYEKNVPWVKTEFFKHVQQQVERGKADWKNSRTLADIKQGCDQVDRLIVKINGEGYKTMKDIIESENINLKDSKLSEELLKYDEIAVDIGRDGEFLFVDGRHRLSIARILDIDKVPVRIVARHQKWQTVRDQVATIDEIESLPKSTQRHLGHPDLEEFTSN
ncbi:hypothetical protein ACLI4Q_18330 [Natrialbaceae archaeon A-CW1-1]